MVAAGDKLYLVQGRYCIGIEGATGERAVRFSVSDGEHHDWSYLAATDGMLIGSRVKKGAVYLGDEGSGLRILIRRTLAGSPATGFLGSTRRAVNVLGSTMAGRLSIRPSP
ncbi:MAG: hypothetical protein Ct9H300mP7_5080 [Verrucomicrobiota bacterium]|nr:MAG: hypothetical protein Ct9H300mP7_5080 [Verrucomicrobiota bacterium]